jgi:hypothetical protein
VADEGSVENKRPIQPSAKPASSTLVWPVCILLAAFTLTILEGAFRKWVVGSEGGVWKYVAYFSKDVMFAGLLVFSARGILAESARVFERWLWAGAAFLVIGAALSADKGFNPVGAALTMRATVVLPFLALLAIPRLRGLPLRWVGWLLALFTILNFVLGVVQNRLPSDHVLNRYAADTEVIVAVESGVRATGTFSYITGLTVLASVGIWAGMTLLSLATNQWQRVGGWASIAAGVGCGLVSVSRAPTVIAIVVVSFWVLFSRASISVLARSMAAGAILAGTLVVFEVVPIFSQLGAALRERHVEAGDTFRDRAFGQFAETGMVLNTAPFGMGLGTEQVGGNFAASGTMAFTSFESQMPRIAMETGVLGLLGFLVICAGAIIALQAAKREASSDGVKAMLLATQLLLLPTFYTNIIFNHTASAFVWMLFAAVLGACAGSTATSYQKVTARNSRRRSARRTGPTA